MDGQMDEDCSWPVQLLICLHILSPVKSEPHRLCYSALEIDHRETRIIIPVFPFPN